MKRKKNDFDKKEKKEIVIEVLLGIALFIYFFCMEIIAADAKEEVYIDEDIWPVVQEVSREYEISPYFVAAVIWTESRWDPSAENCGCCGLMQISTKWHEERMKKVGCEDIFDVEGNIRTGVDYLVELFEQYEDTYLVLMMYNMDQKKAMENYNAGEYSYYAVSICEYEIILAEKYEETPAVIQMESVAPAQQKLLWEPYWKINEGEKYERKFTMLSV